MQVIVILLIGCLIFNLFWGRILLALMESLSDSPIPYYRTIALSSVIYIGAVFYILGIEDYHYYYKEKIMPVFFVLTIFGLLVFTFRRLIARYARLSNEHAIINSRSAIYVSAIWISLSIYVFWYENLKDFI